MRNMTCMSMNTFKFIFGWRKVSKCKKLIKSLHCRLNLLKNRRCWKARQLRNDVAQLIKLGHHQSAFDRVDKIYKEECKVDTYDILADFCKIISLHLSHIHRNRECPNEIKEAISSLQLPLPTRGEVLEILSILRKKLSMKKGMIPNEVKYKLVEEITTTMLKTKPLALEFTSELHQEAVPLASELTSDMQQDLVPLASEFTFDVHQEVVPLASELYLWHRSCTSDMQQEVVPLASQLTSKLHQEAVPLPLELTSQMQQKIVPLTSEFTSELHQMVVPLAAEFTMHQEATANQDVQDTRNEQIANVDFDHTDTQNDRSMTDLVDSESSSENSSTDVSLKIDYRDDIEELQSPLNYGENGKDQRVLVFKLSAIVPEVEIRKHCRFIDYEFKKSENLKTEARGATKSRKISVLPVIESPSYYDKTPPRRRANQDNIKIRKHRRFIDYEFKKSENLKTEARGATKSRKRSVLPVIESPSYYDKTPPRRRANQDNRKRSGMQPHISTPLSGHENMFVKQIKKPGMCSRAFSMPIKCSTKCLGEKEMMRSKLFSVPPTSPHVHPKLPDYDELAGKSGFEEREFAKEEVELEVVFREYNRRYSLRLKLV